MLMADATLNKFFADLLLFTDLGLEVIVIML